MKKFAKLIPALALLLVSFVTLSTASYAWFSMNTTVTASNMEVTAVTPVNLLIANSASGDFANSATADENFGTKKLYPASTADVVKFNAIVNSGNYIKEGLGGVADPTTKFQATTAVTALSSSADGYYAVYDFAVKLSQAQETAANVYLSDLTVYVVYGEGDDVEVATAGKYFTKAGSVYTAVDADTVLASGTTYYTTAGIADAVRVALVVAADANGAAKKVIYGTANSDASVDAVGGDVTANAEFSTLSTTATACVKAYDNTNVFAVNGTAITFQIVVWIEGQDTHCVNANAGQTVSVDFALSVATA